MEVPPESTSGSLTSRSTPMELDAFEQETPARSPISSTLRETPTLEDAENGIIVDAPEVDLADSSALLINPNEDEDDEVITPYHKRKRVSVNYNNEDSLSLDGLGGSPNITGPIAKRSKSLSKGLKVRGIKIGVWRDSSEENDAEKHVIYGFIDVHDRLRTRIYGMNYRNEELIGNLPMGAGGCWITFPKIMFDPHLASLNAAEVKEYVRIRTNGPEAMLEVTPESQEDAVRRAKAIVAQDVTSGVSKPIAHRTAPRKSASRQSLTKTTTSFQAINSEVISTPKGSFYEGKPQGVLLGYWLGSEEPNIEDRHAMYGVLAATDCFRAKVQRITVDGRYVDSNFPIGAGAMWRAYEEIVFLPHLADLTRPEIKEYCRIRLKDQEQRESDKERKANEFKAAAQAKVLCAAEGLGNKVPTPRPNPIEMETRHSSRSEQKIKAKEQAELEAAMEKARQLKNAAMERQHAKTREEIAANTRHEPTSGSRHEILTAKARQDIAANEAAIQEAAKQELKNNLKKLNKVWVAQQNITQSRTPHASGSSSVVSSDEVKYHHGIKYERKNHGPFDGKLAAAPQIFNIDGEDYVEYRVLMKPSF